MEEIIGHEKQQSGSRGIKKGVKQHSCNARKIANKNGQY